MRRTTTLLGLALIVGCATEPVPVAPTRFEPTDVPVAATLDEALREGYKIVDEDGRQLYCRESMRLGSHVRRERTCMTEQEFLAARADSQRKAETMKSYRTPPPVPPPGSPGR
jgi:hypothetical protein